MAAERHGRGMLCVNRPLTEDWRQFGQFRDAELHNLLSAAIVRLITVTSGHVVSVGENAICLPC